MLLFQKKKCVALLMVLSVFFSSQVKADSYISSVFLVLNNGSPITNEQTIRLSLWTDGRIDTGDVSAGVINGSAPHYAGYQAEITETPDSEGRLSIAFSDLASFPEITPANQFMMIEYKNSGDPVSSYVVYDDLYINNTLLDRFPLVMDGPSVFDEVYTNHATSADTFILDQDDSAASNIVLQFGFTPNETIKWDISNSRFAASDDFRIEGNVAVLGQAFVAHDPTIANSTGILNLGLNSSSWESLSWNTSTLRFDLSDDLNLTGGLEVGGNVDVNLNQMVETRLENLGSGPTCNAGSQGRIYQSTGDKLMYICDGTTNNTVGYKHYQNGTLTNNIITATVTGQTTTGATTSIYLTDDGTSGGTKLFTTVYHVSAELATIQADNEASALVGYSYNSSTGELQLKFMESKTVLVGGEGLEGEESGTAFTVFALGK